MGYEKLEGWWECLGER